MKHILACLLLISTLSVADDELLKETPPQIAYERNAKQHNNDSFKYNVAQDRKKNLRSYEEGQSGRNWVRDTGASIVGDAIYESYIKPRD